jgi:hypothetical protein
LCGRKRSEAADRQRVIWRNTHQASLMRKLPARHDRRDRQSQRKLFATVDTEGLLRGDAPMRRRRHSFVNIVRDRRQNDITLARLNEYPHNLDSRPTNYTHIYKSSQCMNNLGTWKSNHRRYFPTRLLRILVVASEAIIIGKNAIRIGKKNARDLFETRSM